VLETYSSILKKKINSQRKEVSNTQMSKNVLE